MKVTPLILLLSLAAFASASAKVNVQGQLVPVKKGEEKSGADGAKEGGGAPAAKPAAAPMRGPGPAAIEQNKAIQVTVANLSKDAEQGIVVRYWIIGRDAKTSKLSLLDGGESQVNLKPNGSETITTEPVKTKFTPPSVFKQTAAKGAAKPGAAAAPAAKPAEAEGTRISGFAIQVIKDGKVLGEHVMDQSHRALIGSDGNKPGPLFKAAKEEKHAAE